MEKCSVTRCGGKVRACCVMSSDSDSAAAPPVCLDWMPLEQNRQMCEVARFDDSFTG